MSPNRLQILLTFLNLFLKLNLYVKRVKSIQINETLYNQSTLQCALNCLCESNISASKSVSLSLRCNYTHQPRPDLIHLNGCQRSTFINNTLKLQMIPTTTLLNPQSHSDRAATQDRIGPQINATYQPKALLDLLQSLNNLDIGGNNLKSTGGSLDHWAPLWRIPRRLKHLNIARNGLITLPHDLAYDIPWIERIDASYNSFRTINSDVWNFLSLIELDLSHNNIHFLDEQSLIHLPSLMTLILDFNYLTSLDYSLFGPGNSPYIGNTRELNTLSFRNNKIDRINPEAFVGLALNGTLDISNNQLDRVPIEALRTISYVEILALSGNLFTILGPSTFSSLNVTKLRITHCKRLKLIHDFAFGHLLFLVNLKLSHNRHLRYISPHALTHSTRLEELDLSHNALPEISKGLINHLSYLGFLDIRSNPIACNCQTRWILKALERRDMVISINPKDSLAKCFAKYLTYEFIPHKNLSAPFIPVNQSHININESGNLPQNSMINFTKVSFDLQPLIAYKPYENHIESIPHRTKPQLIQEFLHPSVVLELGDRVAIPCIATGCPHPTITWYTEENKEPIKYLNLKNPIDLKNKCRTNVSTPKPCKNDSTSYFNGDQLFNLNGDLLLNFVKPSHVGIYTCVAINEAGKSEYKVKIKVRKPLYNFYYTQILSTSIKLPKMRVEAYNETLSPDHKSRTDLESENQRQFYIYNYQSITPSQYHSQGVHNSKTQQLRPMDTYFFIVYAPVKDASRHLISSFKNTVTTQTTRELSSNIFAANKRLIRQNLEEASWDKSTIVHDLLPGTLYEFCLGMDSLPTYFKTKNGLGNHTVVVLSCFQARTTRSPKMVNLSFAARNSNHSGIGKRYALILTIVLVVVVALVTTGMVCFRRLYTTFRLRRLAIKSEKLSQQLFLDNMDLDSKANEKISEEIRLTFENPLSTSVSVNNCTGSTPHEVNQIYVATSNLQ